MFELGYAFATKTPESIVMVFNDAYGNVEALPFDIRFRRPVRYNLPLNASGETRAAARRKLTTNLEEALRSMFQYQGKSEFEPWLKAVASELIGLLVALDSLDRLDEFPYSDLGDEARDLAEKFQAHAGRRLRRRAGGQSG